MKNVLASLLFLGISAAVSAQTKPTPPAVIAIIDDITGKQFTPDTAYAALSDEDATLLTKEPVANWSLPLESGKNMSYYNLVIGTRSYQLLIAQLPKNEFPTATLLRYTTPKSKPDYIARGTLKPRPAEKAK